MRWDVFCQVVDNYGDVGFGWRLAADLGARGEEVRFWLDDARALTWMAPHGAPGVAHATWARAGDEEIGDVVVETFGCGVPDAVATRLARRAGASVWVDLEYLSAESYVERQHGLSSPLQHGPAAGATRWFYFPGFTEATGGLLGEPGLAERQDRHRRARARAIRPAGKTSRVASGRSVTLFCYENPALPALLNVLATEPTRLCAAAGRSTRQVESATANCAPLHRAVSLSALPRLTQRRYDRLLWDADLNFVRGEDSFVRAQWAGVPFVWQVYPQADRAQVVKLEAFLDRFLVDADADLAAGIRRLFRAWNGLASMGVLPDLERWRRHCQRWRSQLSAQSDLGTKLIAFAHSRLLK